MLILDFGVYQAPPGTIVCAPMVSLPRIPEYGIKATEEKHEDREIVISVINR